MTAFHAAPSSRRAGLEPAYCPSPRFRATYGVGWSNLINLTASMMAPVFPGCQMVAGRYSGLQKLSAPSNSSTRFHKAGLPELHALGGIMSAAPLTHSPDAAM